MKAETSLPFAEHEAQLRFEDAGRESPFDLPSYLRSQASPLIIVAHPDDEVLGAGGQLARWTGATFIHVTDGAPLDMRDAWAAGFRSRAEYAAKRKRELREALALAGFPARADRHLNFVDKEASTHLVELTQKVLEFLRRERPSAVLTHPYEGGHPDHDAVAFAVHCACKLVGANSDPAPVLVEMTAYYNDAGLMHTGDFLPWCGQAVTTINLSPDQLRFKQRLLDCFLSQSQVLQYFRPDRERFRLAPSYDFTQPPHRGTLFYEQYGLGMDGLAWRRLAKQALNELGIGRET